MRRDRESVGFVAKLLGYMQGGCSGGGAEGAGGNASGEGGRGGTEDAESDLERGRFDAESDRVRSGL